MGSGFSPGLKKNSTAPVAKMGRKAIPSFQSATTTAAGRKWPAKNGAAGSNEWLKGLLFAADQNDVGADLIRKSVLGILYFAVGIVSGGTGLEFSGFSVQGSPNFA